MSLEALEQIREIGRLESSASEIKLLLENAERKLADSKVVNISRETRLEQAYTVILTCASIALRAKGYRVLNITAGHYLTIETTRDTLEISDDKIDYFQTLRIKRHQDIYGSALIISAQDLDEAISEAQNFLSLVRNWLLEKHPEFIV
jgi:hypothetical protein